MALATIVIFVALAGYGDFDDTVDTIADLPVSYLIAGFGLALSNYLFRYFRWCYYLRVLKIRVPARLNLLAFSGLAMSVTPGKVGELVKCYLLSSQMGVPVGRSAPALVMERLIDVISVFILALSGLAMLSAPAVVVLAVILASVLSVFIFARSRYALRLTRLLILSRWTDLFEDYQEGFNQLATARVIFVGLAIGVVAWSAEGLALWVILNGIGTDMPILRALSIYAVSTLVGAATTLPGGLIGTEGSMLALLQQSGMVKSAASASTVLVRFITLWFAVAIGVVALIVLRRISNSALGESGEY